MNYSKGKQKDDYCRCWLSTLHPAYREIQELPMIVGLTFHHTIHCWVQEYSKVPIISGKEK